MKKYTGRGVRYFFIATILALGMILVTGALSAYACSPGKPGGEEYTPQRRDAERSGDGSILSKMQVLDIVAGYLKRINPALRIGQVRDAGRYFVAEVLTEAKEIVQRLGVDKQTGRIMLVN
ncbi:MAG: hypothetical protein Q8P24_20185 [Desulfobacterales bacterium]|nr:hypothetical protein [Desulfobacterales bacterium]